MDFSRETLIKLSKENLIYLIEKEKLRCFTIEPGESLENLSKEELVKEIQMERYKSINLEKTLRVLMDKYNLQRKEVNVLQQQVEQLKLDLVQSNLFKDLFDAELKAREEEEAKQ